MPDGVERGGGKGDGDQQRHVETVIRAPGHDDVPVRNADSLAMPKGEPPPAEGIGAASSVSLGNNAVKDPVIGSTVNGYVVRGRLGSGGMGIVYAGDHPVIGKRAAIKVLRPEIAENEEQVKRLVSEARAVNAVGHRGIIDVFGYDTLPDGRQCIVMEYLDGEPLGDMLSRNRKEKRVMPIPQVLVVLEEILSALGAAHSAGVIHRDLKPSNIFLCKQRDGLSYVKLLDFGIAKLGVLGSTPQTRASMLVGTPSYMAPEQARGGAVSAAMDLYAVGIMAFEMLTGELPFNGESVVEMLMKHAEQPPPKPSSILMSIPDDLDELVLKLLAKDPKDRYQSADEVRDLLTNIRKTLSESTARSIGLSIGRSIPQSGTPAAATPSPAPMGATGQKPPPAPEETRINPSVSMQTGEGQAKKLPAAMVAQTIAVPEGQRLEAAPRRSSRGLVLGGVGLTLGVAALAVALMTRAQPAAEPPPPAPPAAKVAPAPEPTVAAAEPVAAAPETARVDPAAGAPPPEPEPVRPSEAAPAPVKPAEHPPAPEASEARRGQGPRPQGEPEASEARRGQGPRPQGEPAVKKEAPKPAAAPAAVAARPKGDKLLARFLALQKLSDAKPDALSTVDRKILGKYVDALKAGTVKPEQRDQAEGFANKIEADLKGQ
jgi:serine/threonine-protein kinase